MLLDHRGIILGCHISISFILENLLQREVEDVLLLLNMMIVLHNSTNGDHLVVNDVGVVG